MTRYLLILLFLCSCAAVGNAQQIGRVPNSGPSSTVNVNEVYGHIRFKLSVLGRDGRARQLNAEKFVEDVLENEFGIRRLSNLKGSFLLNLELHTPRGKITQPVMLANWEKKKFLFLTVDETVQTNATHEGVLLDEIRVNNGTNIMAISVNMAALDDSTLDMSVFNELARISKSSIGVALSGFASGIVDFVAPFKETVENIFSRHNKVDLTDTTSGRFTIITGNGLGNHLRYQRGRVRLEVFFDTRRTQLGDNRFQPGVGFVNLGHFDVLGNVNVAGQPVLENIKASKLGDDKVAKSLLRKITEQENIEMDVNGLTAEDYCRELIFSIQRRVSNRDAKAVYWAFIKIFGGKLERSFSNGKSCWQEPFFGEFVQSVNLDISR